MTVHDFDDADALAVGAFGQPGQRLFLLQARRGMEVLTLKIEKGQAAQLATHLQEVLADHPEYEEADGRAALLADESEPAWSVGNMRLGYDRAAERVELTLEAFRAEPNEGEGEDEPDAARVTFTAMQAASLVAAVEQLVAAGRPPCPHCGYPLDPEGHVCPKSNGHRPPKL